MLQVRKTLRYCASLLKNGLLCLAVGHRPCDTRFIPSRVVTYSVMTSRFYIALLLDCMAVHYFDLTLCQQLGGSRSMEVS
jgi:hypothetical protein